MIPVSPEVEYLFKLLVTLTFTCASWFLAGIALAQLYYN